MNEIPVFLTFQVIPDTEAEGGPPKRFSGIAYSGGIVPGYGPYGDCVIDLSSIKLPNKQIFALVDHDPTKRAGRGSLTVDGNAIHFCGEFFTSTPAGQEVAALFHEGAPWELSVGFVAEAQAVGRKTKTINGQSLAVDTVFHHTRITEVSFVPAGADPHTRVAAFAPMPVINTVTEEFKMDDMLERIRYLLNLPTLSTLEEIAAELQKLLDRVMAAETAQAAAEAEMAAIKMSARKTAVETLFAELGREVTEEAILPYIGMTDIQFAAVSADLKAVRPQIPEHLFSEQATHGRTPSLSDEERESQFRTTLIKQVSGL